MKKIQKSKITNNKHRQTSITTERRRAERLCIPLTVKYKFKGAPGPQQCVPMEDISGLGVKICVDKPLKINKPVEVFIIIPDEPKPIEAIGRVAWCKEFAQGEFKAGIEFTKIKDHFRFTELICRSMLELSSMKI